MSKVLRRNRKASDEDIARLNCVGLSLKTIGQLLNLHPSTVTTRLEALGIAPADTRRSFMEDVFCNLDPEIQEWLADKLMAGTGKNIKQFVTELITKESKNE